MEGAISSTLVATGNGSLTFGPVSLRVCKAKRSGRLLHRRLTWTLSGDQSSAKRSGRLALPTLGAFSRAAPRPTSFLGPGQPRCAVDTVGEDGVPGITDAPEVLGRPVRGAGGRHTSSRRAATSPSRIPADGRSQRSPPRRSLVSNQADAAGGGVMRESLLSAGRRQISCPSRGRARETVSSLGTTAKAERRRSKRGVGREKTRGQRKGRDEATSKRVISTLRGTGWSAPWRGTPLPRQVLLQVVHGFPPFGKDNAVGIQGVTGHDVLETALLLATSASIEARLHKPIAFGWIDREETLHNHCGHRSAF